MLWIRNMGDTRHGNIERAHNKFCKRILGVSYNASNASNAAVLSECGRYPLYITYITMLVKFWLKMLYMNENRLIRKSYLIKKATI